MTIERSGKKPKRRWLRRGWRRCSGATEADGFIDTNVFIHSFSNDAQSTECLLLIMALRSGKITARLDFAVLHELSYYLPRFVKQMTREEVADYLVEVLSWPGILAERTVLIDTVNRWRRTPGLGFVDAYLAARAAEIGEPVLTKNVRELRGQGVAVPDPLPS